MVKLNKTKILTTLDSYTSTTKGNFKVLFKHTKQSTASTFTCKNQSKLTLSVNRIYFFSDKIQPDFRKYQRAIF